MEAPSWLARSALAGVGSPAGQSCILFHADTRALDCRGRDPQRHTCRPGLGSAVASRTWNWSLKPDSSVPHCSHNLCLGQRLRTELHPESLQTGVRLSVLSVSKHHATRQSAGDKLRQIADL